MFDLFVRCLRDVLVFEMVLKNLEAADGLREDDERERERNESGIKVWQLIIIGTENNSAPVCIRLEM